jgi:dimethylaniline monooxygenase (N-oxide forming)
MSFKIEKVGIIGAGVSGVVSGKHLLAVGIEVTLFERSSGFGGVWYGPFQ